jgi:peptide/nickel transport system permease protein
VTPPITVAWGAMNFLSFLVKRLALIVLVLFFVSIVIFLVVNILPGDVAQAVLGSEATPAQVEAMRERLGLNRPLYVRYAEWIGGVLRGDLGQSLRLDLPIAPLLSQRLKNSLALAGFALLTGVPLSVALGIIAGVRHGKLSDRSISILTVTAVSLPEYVWGIAFILAFALYWPILPASSLIDPGSNPLDSIKVLILPAATLTLRTMAHTAQLTRTSMIEVLETNYIRTARLKGLAEWEVVVRHALRNGLLPTITVIGMNLGWLLGGLVVVETVFSYPGIGQLMVDAVSYRDVPMIQATVLLIAFAYAVGNLLADLAYAYLNPRIRY